MEHYYGDTIKALRQTRKWTQADLARRLNKAVSTVSGYESNAHPVPIDVMISIATIFSISLDEFVGLGKTESVSVKGLTPIQKDVLKSLQQEYLSPSSVGADLSENQMKILHDIIASFYGKSL